VPQLKRLPQGTQRRLGQVATGLTLNDVGVRATVNLPRRSEFARDRQSLSADAVTWVLAVRRRANRGRGKGTGRAPA
jgi:hypothetical protein